MKFVLLEKKGSVDNYGFGRHFAAYFPELDRLGVVFRDTDGRFYSSAHDPDHDPYRWQESPFERVPQ
jgi:hypothetical protein